MKASQARELSFWYRLPKEIQEGIMDEVKLGGSFYEHSIEYDSYTQKEAMSLAQRLARWLREIEYFVKITDVKEDQAIVLKIAWNS